MSSSKDLLARNFHFIVDWGGTRLGFKEVSGLSAETEVIYYREGNSPEYNPRPLPGRTNFSRVILKRGLVQGDNEFFKYWQSTYFFQEGAQKFRRDIVIKLLDEEHNPAIVWALRNAWPAKIVYGDLNAHGNEIVIEQLELVHEGLSLIDV